MASPMSLTIKMGITIGLYLTLIGRPRSAEKNASDSVVRYGSQTELDTARHGLEAIDDLLPPRRNDGKFSCLPTADGGPVTAPSTYSAEPAKLPQSCPEIAGVCGASFGGWAGDQRKRRPRQCWMLMVQP